MKSYGICFHCVRRGKSCGWKALGCFTMTANLPIMPWTFNSSWLRGILLWWSSLPAHLIWFCVLFSSSPSSRGSSWRSILKMWKTSRWTWWWTVEDLGRILPEVHGGVALKPLIILKIWREHKNLCKSLCYKCLYLETLVQKVLHYRGGNTSWKIVYTVDVVDICAVWISPVVN